MEDLKGHMTRQRGKIIPSTGNHTGLFKLRYTVNHLNKSCRVAQNLNKVEIVPLCSGIQTFLTWLKVLNFMTIEAGAFKMYFPVIMFVLYTVWL